MKTRLYHSTINAMLLLLVSAISMNLSALELSAYFTDNMVLQRDKPVKIWGAADAGKTVSITIAGQTKTGTADKNGQWVVTLDPMNATAKPLSLTAATEGKAPVTVKNLLVGDVWFFGRQSYIDISLAQAEGGPEAAAAYKPSGTLRAIVIKTIPAKTEQTDLHKESTTGWTAVDNKSALTLSAAAFYLGKDLVKELDVPVGIVDVNMERYFAIGWMSQKAIDDSITRHPKDKELTWLPDEMRKKAAERESGAADKALEEYYQSQVEKSKGKPVAKPSLGLHPMQNPMYPSAGYNAVIHPLRHITLKGILLQLGNDYPFIAYRELEKEGKSTVKVELDAAWGENYPILKNGYRVTPVTLPYIPGDWRRTFGDQELPIGLVLPPASDLDVYAAHNREIRELHRRTALANKNVGLILPGMDNVPFSGQPRDEALLADRCKHWVLGAVVGKKDVVPTGPVVDRITSNLTKATVHFEDGTAEGLKAIGDALNYFEAAGPDREFTPAKATIDGSTIKLKSDGPIQFVRYNWEEKPGQDLVNAAGLPALPFSTDASWEFGWIPPPSKPDLPPEYTTTADKWSKSDIAIINGNIANMATGDSEQIPRRPGPLGIFSSPFGPNIYVIRIDPDTPAEGTLMPKDVIYGVNGKLFDDSPDVANDQQYKDLADAITYSETEEAGGKLKLNVRRGTKLIEVELQLNVLGSYSSTTPYYCEKSANIVKNAEKWMSDQYRPESGPVSEPKGMLYTDLLFLLAAGSPENLGIVRRAVYKMMAEMDPQPVKPGMQSKPWSTGHASLILGEYFHATGDRNVLPYLKYQADLSSESQLKPRADTIATKEAAESEEQVGGWRHNYPGNPERWKSGYGLLPHAGMACVMGMQLGKEAGIDIDEVALNRGLVHYNKGRAEYAYVLYSYWNTRRDGPAQVQPEAEAAGKLWSMNGKLGMAASLFNMVEDKDTVEICSRYCVYGFNNTRHGHGGMFFNNFWTPVGAYVAGKPGFKHFMKGQRWWRELFRRHDGSFNQVGRGHIGVSYALPYVAMKERLRILGAPQSAFGTNCPDYLKPAVAAHVKRDYALCEHLIRKQMAEALPAEDMPIVNHLLESVQILRASIEHDLTLAESLIKDGKYFYASLEVPQLMGVVSPDNARLKTIISTLKSPEVVVQLKEQQQEYGGRRRPKKGPATSKESWVTLVKQKEDQQTVDDRWRVKLVEHISQAPEDWDDPSYSVDHWNVTPVPTSWCPYHTALFRNTFHVQDKGLFDAIRVQGKFFQQANVVIYLNGELVAKIDELGRGTGNTDALLNESAMKLLKNGKNTIAISSRHKRRWGPFRGTYKTAARVGFTVQARKR